MRLPPTSSLFAVLLVWYFGIEPSNERDWQTDVAVLPYATIEGDMVTVHNIRNFDYRSETDYTPAYYDKRFDLRKLEGVDLVAVYWMGPAIAHTFVSFAFAGGDHLAISIETRKEKGEGYSTLKGFFRQYELYYVVADERDVIRLRTNYRHDPPEDVYVYRVQGPIENGRRLFMEYIKQDQCAEGQARVLQYADHQLHDQYLVTTHWSIRNICRSAGKSWPAAMCRSTCTNRAGSTPTPAVRRAAAARPRQCPGAGRGQGGGFLAAHPGMKEHGDRSMT